MKDEKKKAERERVAEDNKTSTRTSNCCPKKSYLVAHIPSSFEEERKKLKENRGYAKETRDGDKEPLFCTWKERGVTERERHGVGGGGSAHRV